MAVTAAPLREVPRVGANLQMMREMQPITMNGSQFCIEENALRINYDGKNSICIAMQDADSEAETLVQVNKMRDIEGGNHRIRVSARYTIQNGRLIEDPDRVAAGSQQQQSPHANTHVLAYMKNMLEATCVVEANGRRFYLEWDSQTHQGELRAEVFVSTTPGYGYRLRNQNRALITDRQSYFRGHRIQPADNAADNKRENENPHGDDETQSVKDNNTGEGEAKRDVKIFKETREVFYLPDFPLLPQRQLGWYIQTEEEAKNEEPSPSPESDDNGPKAEWLRTTPQKSE